MNIKSKIFFICRIVFNLIKIGQMKKTDHDKLEDFENVFDFDRELVENFSIPPATE